MSNGTTISSSESGRRSAEGARKTLFSIDSIATVV